METFNQVKRGLDFKRNRLARIEHGSQSSSLGPHFIPGVSVIVPCYKSAQTIEETLTSLYQQTLKFEDYEVIVVFNGEDDGSVGIAREFADSHPEFNLRLFFNSKASAGAARNVGMNLVRHANVTFVDADDSVEAKFLETALDAMPIEHGVVASPIHNLDPNGELDTTNSLNERIRARYGETTTISEVPWLLGFNACKLVSSELLAELRYREDLRSGEDLVFFASLLSNDGLKVVFPESDKDAAYIRRLSDNSVSRQAQSFDFNVKQRVECLAALREIEVPAISKNARIMLERAQVSFVKRYLDDYPEDADELDDLLVTMSFVDFPWNWINDGKARDLAFSYCFVPYADTSGVIAAKAIAERERIVDVVSANMSDKRSKDDSLRFLCSRWLDKTIEVSVRPSFADWKLNVEFAKKAVASARNRQNARGTNYETMYSRALWMGSHIAGAYFKIEYPETLWTAEFSDPLRFDVEGNPRQGELTEDSDSSLFLDLVKSQSPSALEILTIFDLVESVTMILADELVFTNGNQLNYMLSKYPKVFAEMARKKAIIREHPSPREADYQVVKAEPGFSANRINIAYFGAFYVNRGLGDVFTALRNLRADDQRKVALHIYCNDTVEAMGQVVDWGLSGIVMVHPYLPYLQFLNATTQADVLLVNDIKRSGSMEINPFLPSKYSDYRASGTRIWAILDNESPLSKKEVDYSSSNDNVPSSIAAIEQIVADLAE